jgi:hypothetical protein
MPYWGVTVQRWIMLLDANPMKGLGNLNIHELDNDVYKNQTAKKYHQRLVDFIVNVNLYRRVLFVNSADTGFYRYSNRNSYQGPAIFVRALRACNCWERTANCRVPVVA